MKAINEVWETYRSCWSNPDSVQRTEKLQNILSDDFEYKDPSSEITGYQQLSDYMKQFQEQFEGASFETADMNIHHNRILIHWNMVNDQKEVVSNGSSFALYENDKLKQITGFFKES